MKDPAFSDRILLLVMCLLAAAWGTMGWLDLPHQAFAGFDTDSNNVVTRVYAGGPAEIAGLVAGDQLSHFDGIALQDSGTLARLPRKKAGDARRLTIEREEGTEEIVVVYAATLAETLNRSRVTFLTGLCFLLFPLLAYLRQPGELTRLLVLMGFGLGLAFLPGPYIGDFSMRSLAIAITSLFTMLGLVALLQFLLSFPHRRSWLRRLWARAVLYSPAILLWFLIAYRILFTPEITTGLNVVTQFLSGVIVFIYLVASLYQLLRNYSRTDRAVRKLLSMNAMLIATVVAFLPVMVAQLAQVFSPNSALPGQDYYFVSLALLPMFWARSAVRATARDLSQ